VNAAEVDRCTRARCDVSADVERDVTPSIWKYPRLMNQATLQAPSYPVAEIRTRPYPGITRYR